MEIKPEFIDNMRKIQSEVLESYSCKTRRKMVYATCSILPSENQEQIERFLTTDIEKSLNLSKTKKILVQNLVLTVLHGLERKEKVKPRDKKEVKA
jgi:16S rRNA (cytosine967-C5)-methyltransferase